MDRGPFVQAARKAIRVRGPIGEVADFDIKPTDVGRTAIDFRMPGKKLPARLRKVSRMVR